MNQVNIQFLIALGIIAIGYIIKITGVVSEKEGESLAKIILNVTLPALILNTFTHIKIEISLLILCLVCILFGILLAIITFFLFKHLPKAKRGILTISSLGFNIGLFAYPLIEGIWGKEGLTHIAMFDMGNTFIIFGLCYVLACIYSPNNTSVDIKYILKKLAGLVPLYAYILALILNLINFQFPIIASDIISVLSEANGGLVYLLLGIYLNFSLDKDKLKSIGKIILLRYSVGILIGLLLYYTLPFSLIFKGILLISLIMPVGMAIIPYSITLGYDKKLAGMAVNISNVISFGLIWILANTLQIN